MFLPVKSNTGALLPWEYLGAAADTYQAGQLLTVTDGKLSKLTGVSTTTPPYLCMADVTAADGQIIPVTWVEGAFLYETTLSAAYSDAKPGVKVQVAEDGLTAAQGTGTFELVEVAGTQKGDTVRGRFV